MAENKPLTKSEVLWMKHAANARASISTYENDPDCGYISNEYLLYTRGSLNSIKETIVTLTNEWTDEMEEQFMSLRKRLNKLKLGLSIPIAHYDMK